MVEMLKVSSKSSPNSVAGAIANSLKDQTTVEVQAIGAGALNQAIKAIAIARGFLAPVGKDIYCVPSFSDADVAGEERTAIKLLIKTRWEKYLSSFFLCIEKYTYKVYYIVEVLCYGHNR